MKTDRLIGILTVLLDEGETTAPKLARRFEVSRRTITRDIDALNRAGIPIRTTQGAGGGIAIMEGYRLDRQLLTGDDMRAILAGLRSLDSVSRSNRYALLMDKLSPGASGAPIQDERVLVNLASWYGGSLSEKLARIRESMDAGRAVRFQYHAPKGESSREVEPGYLVFQWSSWYLWGYCRMREAFRLFKLNRMTALELGGACSPREFPLPDLSTERVFPSVYDVVALVDPAYRWRLIEEYGAESFTEQPDGRLRFQFGFTDRDQVLTWMTSFRGGAELIEPREFRSELRALGQKLMEMYKEE